MKNFGTYLRRYSLLGCLPLAISFALLPLNLSAEEKDTPKPTERPARPSDQEDLEALKAFMELPPERLAEIRVSIEAIEKMSPRERKRLLHRLQEYEKQPREERQKHLKRFNQLSPAERRAYFEHMKGMSPQEKASFRKLPWEKQLEAIRNKADE